MMLPDDFTDRDAAAELTARLAAAEAGEAALQRSVKVAYLLSHVGGSWTPTALPHPAAMVAAIAVRRHTVAPRRVTHVLLGEAARINGGPQPLVARVDAWLLSIEPPLMPLLNDRGQALAVSLGLGDS